MQPDISPTQQDALPSGPRSTHPYSWVIVAPVCVFACIVGMYILMLPPLHGPDEPDHVRYIQVIRDHRVLPVLPRYAAPEDGWRVSEQAQHPPLYYTLMAVLSLPVADLSSDTGIRMLKLLSSLMGLGAVVILALCARRLWPDDVATALGAVSFCALLPCLHLMTSAVNNTSGSIFFGALTLFAVQGALVQEKSQGRRWALAGAALGAALLCKLTALWLVPVVIGAMVLHARRHALPPGVIIRSMVLPVLVPVALFTVPWLARNFFLFGEILPERVLDRRFIEGGFPTMLMQPFARAAYFSALLGTAPLSLVSPYWLLRTSVRSEYFTLVTLIYFIPALVGVVMVMRRAWRRRLCRNEAAFLALCALGVAGAWLVMGKALLHDWVIGLAPGRYGLDAAPALAFLAAVGWRAVLPPGLKRSAGMMLWTVAALVHSCFMVLCVLRFYDVF